MNVLRWSTEDIESLRREYGKIPTYKIAETMGRSIQSIYRMARKMHLRGSRHWPKPQSMKDKLRGRVVSLETREKIRRSKIGKHYSWDANRKKARFGVLNPFYGKHHSAETIERIRAKLVGKRHSPEVNAKKGRGGELNPFYGKTHKGQPWEDEIGIPSESAKRLWQDPTYIKMMMAARNTKPNKAEIRLDTILQQNFSNEWKYTGDGRDGTTIGGRIPDFINVNGKKRVIELFGEFWHNPSINPKVSQNRTAEATKKHYGKYGLDCLIILDKELKEPDLVISRIKEWKE